MRSRERIDVAPAIAIVGALLLLVSLFLDWYEPDIDAWTVFEVLDLLLAALALGCLIGAAGRLGLELPGSRALRTRFAAAGVVALVIVVSQAINHPPAAVGEDAETGLWLGLAGAGLLALGGVLSVTRISFAVDVEERPATPPPPGGAAPAGGPDPAPPAAGSEAKTTPLDPPPGGPR